MSIQFDFKASLENQFEKKSFSADGLKNEINELDQMIRGLMKKFKGLYDSSHMRQFRRKYEAGKESNEDLALFHRESLELLDLSDKINHLRNLIDKKKKELDAIIKMNG